MHFYKLLNCVIFTFVFSFFFAQTSPSPDSEVWNSCLWFCYAFRFFLLHYYASFTILVLPYRSTSMHWIMLCLDSHMIPSYPFCCICFLRLIFLSVCFFIKRGVSCNVFCKFLIFWHVGQTPFCFKRLHIWRSAFCSVLL